MTILTADTPCRSTRNPLYVDGSVVGGSTNGNGIYAFNSLSSVAPYKITTSGTYGVAWGGLAYTTVSPTGSGLYVSYNGVSAASSTGETFSGLNLFWGAPIVGGSVDGWITSQYSTLAAFSAVQPSPRGYLIVPQASRSAQPQTIWALESTAGLFLFTRDVSGTWAQQGPWAVSDTFFNAVALSGDGSTVYVTATHGVYAFSTSTKSWFSNGLPVVVAPAQNGGQSIYRGLALSIASASVTATPSTTVTQSSTVSSSPSMTTTASSTPSPSSSLTIGQSPSSTSSAAATTSNTPSVTTSPSQTPTQSGTCTVTQTPSHSPTPSNSPTPTQSSSNNGVLSYGTMLLFRIGTGSQPATYANTQTAFIEEWSLPTVAGESAQLKQIIPIPGLCGAIATSASTTQGGISRAVDGSHVVFSCYNSAAGSAKSAALLVGQLYPSGVPSMLSTSLNGANSAYEIAGLTAFNASLYCASRVFASLTCVPHFVIAAIVQQSYMRARYASPHAVADMNVIGGSNNGNSIQWWSPTTPGMQPSQVTVHGTTTTVFNPWGSLRSIVASPSGQGIYVGYAGTSSVSSTGVVFAGLNYIPAMPGWSSTTLVDGWDNATHVQISAALTDPRGFVVSADRSTIWAAEATTGLYRLTSDAASVWSAVGGFTPGGTEAGPFSGLSMSADGTTVYISGTRGVYAFSASSLSWLSNTPVVVAPAIGSGQSLYRGLALSPARPSPTTTRSNTGTATMTLSSSMSSSISSSASPSSSVSPPTTPSETASGSASHTTGASSTSTKTETPSPSTTATGAVTSTQTITSSSSVTASASPTGTPVPTLTGTPTASRTAAITKSSTATPSSTTTPLNRPFTLGSIAVLRIGDGSYSSSSTAGAPVFIDEYELPTVASGSAVLLQTLKLPSTCTAAAANVNHGLMTRSGDGSALSFICYSSAVGSTPTSVTAVLGLVLTSGNVLPFVSVDNGGLSSVYAVAGVAALTSATAYVAVTSGGGNNGIFYYAGGVWSRNTAGAFSNSQWGQFGALLAASSYPAASQQAGLYSAFIGTPYVVSTTRTIAGILFTAGAPEITGAWDPTSAAQTTVLGPATVLTAPRGFVFAPPAQPGAIPAALYATDNAAGLAVLAFSGGSWSMVGVYNVGDANYGGVAVSLDGTTAYVTAALGIYGFSTTRNAWFSTLPLVASPGTGTLQACFRGIANSPVNPSASHTPTTSSTTTPTKTGTPTTTPSSTGSSSASASYGTSPTNTLSGTPSPSVTPSASATRSGTPISTVSSTGTPSASLTPLSPNPVRVRITTSGTAECLNFVEMFVFSSTAQNVAASAAGAILKTSSTYGLNVAAYGGDLLADPIVAAASSTFVNTLCNGATTDYYQATFPATRAFPAGLPVPVSAVYFVNRLDGGFNTRITAAAGAVQLFSTNGSQVASGSLSAASVTTLTFGPLLAAPTPNPTSDAQVSPSQRAAAVRWVTVYAAPASCLKFRE